FVRPRPRRVVAQGLLGNAALEAFAAAYDPRIARFRLTDQQLLDEAGLPHGPGHSYFDVSPLRPPPRPARPRGPGGRPRPAGRRACARREPPAEGAGFRGAGGPLLNDPGSFLVPANP